MSVTIRDEAPGDRDAIRAVHRRAFGRDDEGRLVDALHDGGYARASLVAEESESGQVVGHLLFTVLPIETPGGGTVEALALGPLAVVPDRQRHGIGSAMIREGLRVCARRGHRIVIVLGHPGFYSRFGFSAERARPLDSPYSGPAFMALELAAGSLAGVAGKVNYPPPFEGL